MQQRLTWQLHVSIEKNGSNARTGMTCSTVRLVLSQEIENIFDGSLQQVIIGWIESNIDNIKCTPIWICYFYPNKEGFYSEISVSTLDELSGKWHTFKNERENCASALQCLLDLTFNRLPRTEFTVLAEIGSKFLPTLRQLAGKHFR
jgi:hypothetical protein